MRLQKGIQFFEYNAASTSRTPRIWLSKGTVPASAVSPLSYSRDAFLPLEPWDAPSSDELELLQTTLIPIHPSSSIAIVRLSDDVFLRFRQIGLFDIEKAQDVRKLVKHAEYQAALGPVLDSLAPFFLSRADAVINVLASNPAGLPTVTFDPQRNAYIGLHLDSWDRLPLSDRDRARTRICINMGSQDRFLLFINLTMQSICKIVNEQTKKESVQHLVRMGGVEKFFMLHYSDYPVVKLRISPGEAYIAPTENMIHDGSTIGQDRLDVILTVRGHLGLSSHSF